MVNSPKLLLGMRLVTLFVWVWMLSVRFLHLDRKVYWHDEVYTSLIISAQPGKYFRENLFQNQVVTAVDLRSSLKFAPQLTLSDMLVRQGTEDVQHPPAYYVLLRFWALLWGTDPAIIRTFSALVSLLLFPAIFGLCRELFESALSSWVGVALFAVSPLHLVYGQEAREFGVWTALILIATTFLLRAMRSPSRRSWMFYGISMVVALYTGLFSVCVILGHLTYVLGVDQANRWRFPLKLGEHTLSYLITTLGIGVLFLPWLYFLVASSQMLQATTAWTALPLPLAVSGAITMLNFSRSFVDFNLGLSHPLAYACAIPLLLLQGYTTYFLVRTAPRRVWWLILTLVGSTALVLGIPDLLGGGQRFTVARYQIASCVGLQLSVVYWLSTFLAASQRWKRFLAKGALGGLMVLGILSCSVYTQSSTWWNKELNVNYPQVADLINQADRPLILVDSFSYNPASMVSLSYLVKPETKFLLLSHPAVKSVLPVDFPQGKPTLFFVNLPESFRQQFALRYSSTFSLAFKDNWNEVWRAECLFCR